jgi:hypothetical protein
MNKFKDGENDNLVGKPYLKMMRANIIRVNPSLIILPNSNLLLRNIFS